MPIAKEFIRTLQQIGNREMSEDEEDEVDQLVYTELAQNVPPILARRFEYTIFEWENPNSDKPFTLQGLTLSESQILLSMIIRQLRWGSSEMLEAVFKPLGLSAEQGRSALNAAFWIVTCLDWENRDRAVDQSWTPDFCERYTAAVLRSLQNFRETGEP